jgi:transposase
MQFVGIGLHTNKFTCRYRDENSGHDGKKETAAFELSPYGMTGFCRTLTRETYALIEATITAFCFTRLIQPFVKQAIAANAYELKQISLARKNSDKIDADILCRILKMQALSGEQTISAVVAPPVEIQELRGLLSACRLYRKQTTQIKNHIHSLLRERLYGFTKEEILPKSSGKRRGRLKKAAPCPSGQTSFLTRLNIRKPALNL